MFKKSTCFLLSLLLFFNFSVNVAAENSQMKFEYLKNMFKFFGSESPVITDFAWDVVESKLRDSGELDEDGNIVHVYGGGHGRYFGDDDNGNLTLKAELLQELTAAMQEKAKALNGYYIYDNFTTDWSSSGGSTAESYLSSVLDYFYNQFNRYPSIVTYTGKSSVSPSNDEPYTRYSFACVYNEYGLCPLRTGIWAFDAYGTYKFRHISYNVYNTGGFKNISTVVGSGSDYDKFDININEVKHCVYAQPLKLFYSTTDYDLYRNAVEGGQEPSVYYYAPQYSGGDIVVNNKVYNNYANGTYNDADLQKKLDDILHQLEQDKGDTFDNLNESDRQYIVDHLFELYLQTLGDEDQWTGQEPETSPGGGGGSGSGGSGIDYTEILEQILAACKNTDNNIAQLLALFREFSGREGCQYDFGELKTYLEKVFADNHSDMAALQDRLDSSNAYLDAAVQRLDSIYERLGGFADYTEILDAIYDAISGGEYSLDDLVRALDAFASANHTDLDAILTAIQTSNRYFELLLGRLPKSFAESYDDTDLLEVLDEMLDELVINNDYNEKILKQLENIYDFMTQESFMKHVQDKARQCADKASEVFPTSIPWDMARLVNALAAKPETPVITVPIHVESLGVEESFTVDLHFFDEYAGKFRTVVVVLFAAGLMGLTITIFKDKFF